jgi:hypothetical protein
LRILKNTTLSKSEAMHLPPDLGLGVSVLGILRNATVFGVMPFGICFTLGRLVLRVGAPAAGVALDLGLAVPVCGALCRHLDFPLLTASWLVPQP